MSTPRKARVQPAPEDPSVAWALAAAVAPNLTRGNRDRIYIAIGVGDTFAAIDDLITSTARERLLLDEELIGTVSAWLDCYLGHDAEPRLRELLTELTTCPAQQTSQGETRPGYVHIAERDGHRSAG